MKKFLDTTALVIFYTVLGLFAALLLAGVAWVLYTSFGWWAYPAVAAVLIIGWAFNRTVGL